MSAPKLIKMSRKGKKYITSVSSGPHPKKASVSLLYLVRDMLQITENAREARKLISSGSVKVDGRVQKSRNFPVGLMDVIDIGNDKYRFLIGKLGFYLTSLDDGASKKKLLRITGKSVIKGGKYQIHFHDGRNLIADTNEGYTRGGVVLWDLVSSKIDHVYNLEKGAEVIVIDGKNRGIRGTLMQIKRRNTMLHRDLAVIMTGGESKEVPLEQLFVLGAEADKYMGKEI